jgi:hypothetical protein
MYIGSVLGLVSIGYDHQIGKVLVASFADYPLGIPTMSLVRRKEPGSGA